MKWSGRSDSLLFPNQVHCVVNQERLQTEGVRFAIVVRRRVTSDPEPTRVCLLMLVLVLQPFSGSRGGSGGTISPRRKAAFIRPLCCLRRRPTRVSSPHPSTPENLLSQELSLKEGRRALIYKEPIVNQGSSSCSLLPHVVWRTAAAWELDLLPKEMRLADLH